MALTRILGIVLALVGLVAAVFPQWFAFLTGAAEPTAEVFEAVERRVRGGMVFAVGLILIGVTELRPWSVSIPSTILYFVSGVLAVRIFGIIVEGGVPKQWLWVTVEAGVMALVALWLWRATGTSAE